MRKLIFIYGPPASGKLTTARELQKLTGYKLIHNHMSANVASQFFNFGTNEFDILNSKIQSCIIKSILKSDAKGIIFTKFYIESRHGLFLRKLETIASKNNFKICFVKLESHMNVLLKGVGNKSRKKEGKLLDKNVLKESIGKLNLGKIPRRKNLIIDNSKLSARKTALKIKRELTL
jgi:tRNA uridine 5-carbamoylmethylation protein Kti12